MNDFINSFFNKIFSRETLKKLLFLFTMFTFSMGLVCFINLTPDNDVWARLTAGAYIFENHAVLKHDFLSYTQTHPWLDHEWGASLIFYSVFKYFGETGLVFLKGILAALTVFFCFKTAAIRKPQSSHPYNILYYAFMLWAAAGIFGAIIRCLMFTCLFFAVFLYILERYRKKGGKSLILLPFLMILWANIHGGCISALGLLGIYIIGEYLNKRPVKPYIFVLAGCIAAMFINPYGIDYVKFLFSAGLMDRHHITEWLSPFNPKSVSPYFKYRIYLLFILFTQLIYLKINKITFKQLDKTKFILLLAVTYLSVMHIRHITFFVFTAGALMYEEFYNIFNAFINKITCSKTLLSSRFGVLKNVCIYFFLLILTLPALIFLDKKVRITETAYPRFSIEFVKINNLKGNLFISFDWGSYAAYKLYPNNLIFMDGRYEEVYDPQLLLDIKDFHMLKGDWYKIIRDYKTDVIILDKKYPVYNVMMMHPDWKNVFENNVSGVFVPVSKVKDKYIYPKADDDYYNNSVFETSNFISSIKDKS